MTNEYTKKYMEGVDTENKKVVTIKEWWEKQHYEDEPFLLSGNRGSDIWERLRITNEVCAGRKILNIGVGLGYCTTEMANLGVDVNVLDISQAALDRVKEVVDKTWLPENLSLLPKNYFDLAISNLVAQHMSDTDIVDQMKWVIESLKPESFFAIQFAYSIRKDYRFTEDFYYQKWGGVMRSLTHIADLVEKAQGKIAWIDKIGYFPEHGTGWYGVHIVKNNSLSVNLYDQSRRNIQFSKLIENEGDIHAGMEEWDEAYNSYVKAKGYNPNNLSVSIKLGKIFIDNNDSLSAYEMFKNVYEINRNNLNTVLGLVDLSLELGYIDEAYNILINYEKKNLKIDLEAVEDNISYTNACNALADVYLFAGAIQEAKSLLEIIIRNYPDNILIIEKLKYLSENFDAGNSESFEIADEESIKLLLAEDAIENSEFAKAKILLKSIIDKEDFFIPASIDLGIVSVLEDNYTTARDFFLSVLEKDPFNQIALENLEYIKEESKDEAFVKS